MNKISIEVLSTGKKYVLCAPLHIGRQHDCSIYLDNPVLGEKIITVTSDENGEPLIFGPSGKRLHTDVVKQFGLSVKKHKKTKFLDILKSRNFKLLGIFIVSISTLYFGFKKESSVLSHSTLLSLKVDTANNLAFGKKMENLKEETGLILVDFLSDDKQLYLEFSYSDLDLENELEIKLGKEKIYSSNGLNPCFFKLCHASIDLNEYIQHTGANRIRFIHNGVDSSYLIRDIKINTKRNVDSLATSYFKKELDRAIRLNNDSSVSSSNLVEAMEIIFELQKQLIKLVVNEKFSEQIKSFKKELIQLHMKRVETLEFNISKNLRLKRYDEARVGLSELLALTLKHEYSRKQWINKNLHSLEKLMKEKRHGI